MTETNSDEEYLIDGETVTTAASDNDSLGDGEEEGCAVLSYSTSSSSSGISDTQESIVLAFVLIFVAVIIAFITFVFYSRYRERELARGESAFRYDTSWQKAGNNIEQPRKQGWSNIGSLFTFSAPR